MARRPGHEREAEADCSTAGQRPPQHRPGGSVLQGTRLGDRDRPAASTHRPVERIDVVAATPTGTDDEAAGRLSDPVADPAGRLNAGAPAFGIETMGENPESPVCDSREGAVWQILRGQQGAQRARFEA